MPNLLTATMVECLAFMADHGGELVRYQGGYLAPRGEPRRSHDGVPERHFGGSTVNGLVARGEAVFIEWRDGRVGRFPIVVGLPRPDTPLVSEGANVGALDQRAAERDNRVAPEVLDIIHCPLEKVSELALNRLDGMDCLARKSGQAEQLRRGARFQLGSAAHD